MRRHPIKVWIRKCLTRDNEWFWWCSCAHFSGFTDTQPEAITAALNHMIDHPPLCPRGEPRMTPTEAVARAAIARQPDAPLLLEALGLTGPAPEPAATVLCKSCRDYAQGAGELAVWAVT